jgi:hypothetical protein
MLRSSWVAERLEASQGGLSSMKLGSYRSYVHFKCSTCAQQAWAYIYMPDFCKMTYRPSGNTTVDALPAWRSTPDCQWELHVVSVWTVPWLMDRPWLYADMATAFTGSQPVKLPCMRSHEKHAYHRKVNTNDELLQWVSDAARPVRSAAVPRKVLHVP